MSHKAVIEKSLWAVADNLRGKMDASVYQKYMLSVIFYKYLSEITEKKVRELADEGTETLTISQIWDDPDYEGLDEEVKDSLGFVVPPQFLYSSLLAEIEKGTAGRWSTDLLQEAFNSIIESTQGSESQNDFDGLFDDVQLDSTGLGSTIGERNSTMGTVLKEIGKIDFHLEDSTVDVLGDAYEYLIGKFAAGAGKKGGEFYTPQEVSTLVSRVLAHENPDFKTIYDPTCGSGSLLLRMARESHTNLDNLSLYGQERNFTTYNLARMNMILHGVRWTNFEIANGDTLTDDKFRGKSFDVISANPPYSLNWEHTPELSDDERFSSVAKLAPKNKADFAFVQHIAHHLSDDGGTAAVVLPHGVLFRGGAEGLIRKHLLENNLIHAIIGLPENLFYGTSIPTCVLVLKKGRDEGQGILFIDASNEFEKNKNQNKLRDEDIARVLSAYSGFTDVERFARLVSAEEVKENDYNLNIPRYVDTAEPEELLDLDAIETDIARLKEQRIETKKKIDEFISQLVPSDG